MPMTIRLNDIDNLVVSLKRITKGTETAGVVALEDIPTGHKMATQAIAQGEAILKLGQIIGFASQPIAAGAWIHSHNTMVREFERDLSQAPNALVQWPPLQPDEIVYFDGYLRSSGRVGTRNYLAIMSSVNCSATAVRAIAHHLNSSGILKDYPNIDGVIQLSYGGDCSLKQDGPGYEIMKRTQYGYLANPNIGGAVMVGLGCEGFQIDKWMASCGLKDNELFRSMTLQGVGGTRKTVEAGVAAITEMLPLVNQAHRSKVPASELMLALQCGGSDGYSGITSNPALGVAADLLVQQGGTAILSETPEIFGAEHLLARRAVKPELVARLADIIEWWKTYTRTRGVDFR